MRGHDGGKKLWGRQRHIVVHSLGLLLMVLVTASADDGPEVLGRLAAEHRSRLGKVWADGRYNDRRLDGWMKQGGAGYVIEVVGRPAGSKGFVLLHRRRVVERSFSRLGRYRRDSRDYERYPRSSEAVIKVCSIHRMPRFLRPDELREPAPFNYRKTQEIIPG